MSGQQVPIGDYFPCTCHPMSGSTPCEHTYLGTTERPGGEVEQRLAEVLAELEAVKSERDFLRSVVAARQPVVIRPPNVDKMPRWPTPPYSPPWINSGTAPAPNLGSLTHD